MTTNTRLAGHFYSIDERHGETVVGNVCTTDDRGGARRIVVEMVAGSQP